MKLLTKTTLYFITVTLFVFFIGGIAIYQLIKNLENHKVNQELVGQMQKLSNDLQSDNFNLENKLVISSSLISIVHTKNITRPNVRLTDTLLFDQSKNSYIPYRALSFFAESNKSLYKISIYKSLTESNYLIEKIAMMVTVMVIIFLWAVYFLYRYFFRQIWADFFDTIDKINQFDISLPEKLNFPDSMIVEFNQLNSGLKLMTERIIDDFQGLKDFTGNLSHEIQTPLAVIKSKSELLLQTKNQTEEELQLTGEIHAETIRLSKLIKALTLLTKISNKQFTDKEKVSLKKLITTQLKAFEEIILMKGIRLQLNILSEPKIEMNPELANILIINLIKNAIRHNIDQGKIDIQLNSNYFTIKNSGMEPGKTPGELFNRFSKADAQSESLGIGLSIVKKICDFYGFKISYSYQDKIHQLSVYF